VTSATATSERERRVALYRSVFEEIFNRGNLDYIETVLSPDFVFNSPAEEEPVRGREGYRAFAQRIRTGFPDIRITVHDVLAEGDAVAGRMTIEGTHTGVYLGVPPTRRRVNVSQIVWGRFDGDQIAEAWQELNAVGLLQTLGVVPPRGVGPLGLIGWAFATVGRIGVLQARYARRRK
jgi:steroid delta-isomerase-like uncharacterized protein